MRATVVAVLLALSLSMASLAVGDLSEANPDDIRMIHKSLRGAVAAPDETRMLQTDKGHVRFLGAPTGGAFESEAASKAKASKAAILPEEAGKAFLSEHGRAFGVASSKTGFKAIGTSSKDGRGYARMAQTYKGIPVFGGSVFVQTDQAGGVISILSDIMRDTAALDAGSVSLTPGLSQAQATEKAVAMMKAAYTGNSFSATTPVLVIYDPSVVGSSGPPRPAWQIEVKATNSFAVEEVVLVDAHTGDVLHHHPLIAFARNRLVYDAGNMTRDPGTLERREGDVTPTGIEDVDMAYDYLGDTYDFYFLQHGRDSIDGKGMALSATVRYCDPYYGCPMENAFYSFDNNRMYFGTGYPVDDVTAHELTHGVTLWSSNLAYNYESGAINECFSDVWGEFVDLTNGRGDDSDSVRWIMGEDLPIDALRSMKNPPLYDCPEIYQGPHYYNGPWDYGGVHTNSGVGNKLCYLLTDGDTFNGYTIAGMGIEKTAALFYRVQAVLLTAGGSGPWHESHADYADFAELIIQAATDLAAIDGRFTFGDVTNVKAATTAVGIRSFLGTPLRDLRVSPIADSPDVVLFWRNPIYPFFNKTVVVRNADHFPSSTADGAVVYEGNDENVVDTDLTQGQTYYYTVFATFTDTEPVQTKREAVVVGEEILEPLYEAFPHASDLSYTQVLYSPVGLAGSGKYTVTVTKNVTELPHTSQDALYLRFYEDQTVLAYLPQAFPFLGEEQTMVLIAENGYIAFVDGIIEQFDPLNFPGGNSPLSLPRICPAFADLSTSAGGSIWVKLLDDRVVLTYDHVPQYGRYFYTNTAQVEMFYSGHIRITSLGLTAREIVCGVADGRGVIYDPEELANTGELVAKTTDISALPIPDRITLDPIPNQFVSEGDLVQFMITANAPNGTPSIFIENMPEGAVLNEVTPTQARFTWQTDASDSGSIRLVVGARENGQTACQEVLVVVGNVFREPSASNLQITPAAPQPGDTLVASWDLHSPEGYDEDISQIEWYRNGLLVLPLLNAPVVPGHATRNGDSWYFILTPHAYVNTDNGAAYITGEPVHSPVVTIGADAGPGDGDGDGEPEEVKDGNDVNRDTFVNVLDVQLVINGFLGIDIGQAQTDVNIDGSTTAVDVQLVVTGVLSKR